MAYRTLTVLSHFLDDFAPERLKKLVTSRCDSKKYPLTPLEAVCMQLKCALLQNDIRADIEKALIKAKTFGPSYLKNVLRLLRQDKDSVNLPQIQAFPLISFDRGAWKVEGSGKFATVVSTTYDL